MDKNDFNSVLDELNKDYLKEEEKFSNLLKIIEKEKSKEYLEENYPNIILNDYPELWYSYLRLRALNGIIVNTMNLRLAADTIEERVLLSPSEYEVK